MHSFAHLTNEEVLKAAESLGFKTTGRVMSLASMENRVYEVEIELEDDVQSSSPSEAFRIFKFYRPGRWSSEQIQEEHDFVLELASFEIEAIAPQVFAQRTLFTTDQGLYFCCFKKQGGRAIDEWQTSSLEQIGRLLGRVHAIGKTKKLQHRLTLNPTTYGRENLNFLLKNKIIPLEFESEYARIVNQICDHSDPLFEHIKMQRVHGDCHHGNTLMGRDAPFLIDFDDMVNAPCVQDLWMIVPGRDEESIQMRHVLEDAYSTMNDFDPREWRLVESLRALRMIHYSAWIAHRIEDDSFKRAFPHFGQTQYWNKEIFDLQTQLGYIQDNLNQSRGAFY